MIRALLHLAWWLDWNTATTFHRTTVKPPFDWRARRVSSDNRFRSPAR